MGVSKEIAKKVKEHIPLLSRSDGWQNILTGLGIHGKDKRMSGTFKYERLVKLEAEEFYGCDDIAKKIVDIIPDEMMREGFEISHGLEDHKLSDEMIAVWEELGGPEKFSQALRWARLYGGSGIILGVEDGQDPSEPVNESNIKSISFMNTMNRWELHCLSTSIQRDPTEQGFGLPQSYMLNPEQGAGQGLFTIHESRVIRFDGEDLPKNLFIRNGYWHDSSLNRAMNAVRNYQLSHDSIAGVMQDFAQGVYKIKNLTEMIALGKDDLVTKRLQLVDTLRSIFKAVILETDEEFERKVTTLTGVDKVMKIIGQRLVHATNIPHTVLLGESPSGLGATGESEKSDWYNTIKRFQQIDYTPQLSKFFKYLFLAKDGPTGGREPNEWFVQHNPLEQMSPKEEAEIYKIECEADVAYVNSGVLDPDEVAMSRFADSDSRIQIDKTLRGKGEPLRQPPEGTPAPPPGEQTNSNTAPNTDAAPHTHKDQNGNFIGESFDLENGKHTHFGGSGMWSDEPNTPGHTHRDVRNNIETTEPELVLHMPKKDGLKPGYKKPKPKLVKKDSQEALRRRQTGDTIQKEGDDYVVLDERSRRLLGRFDSKPEAEAFRSEILEIEKKANK